jgi:hypothetical protein
LPATTVQGHRRGADFFAAGRRDVRRHYGHGCPSRRRRARRYVRALRRQSAQVRTACVVRAVAPVLRTAAVCVDRFGAWSIKEAVKMPDDRRALTCFSFREAGATVRAPHERIFEAHSRSPPEDRRPGEETSSTSCSCVRFASVARAEGVAEVSARIWTDAY